MMSRYKESCFFLDLPDGQFLYGFHYLPERTPTTAVLLIPPIGRERLRAYRESANLARALADAGHAVLRFDYRGEGESSGQFFESTVDSRLEDIRAVAGELMRRSPAPRLVLLGLHLGGLLAVLAAESLKPFGLLLVDPISQPAQYGRNLLRSNVILQTHHFGEVSRDEAALREDLGLGKTVSVYGFQLGQPLLEALEGLDPEPAFRRFEGTSAVLYLTPKEAPPKADIRRLVDLLRTRGRAEAHGVVLAYNWTSRTRWSPSLDPLNRAVIERLEAWS